MRFEKRLQFAKELPQKYVVQLAREWQEQTVEVIEEIRSWEGGRFGQTKRKNGQVVGDPRDIVDTGKLRDSIKVAVVDNVARMKMASHGEYVIMGDPDKGIPPRNFPMEGYRRIRYRGAKLS